MNTVDLSKETIERIAARTVELLNEHSTHKQAIIPDAIYTAAEAAKIAGVSLATMQQRLNLGLIVGKRKGRRWRVKGSELLKLA